MLPNLSGPYLSVVKIIVGDVDRVFEFYSNVLGLEQHIRVQEGEGHDQLDEIISKPVGADVAPIIAIKCFVNRPPPVPGEVQIGFIVKSVDQIIDAALLAGGEIAKAARDYDHHGVRVAFIRDIEGHMIELIELK